MRALLIICLLQPVFTGRAAEHLPQAIDRLIASKAGNQPLAGPASDAEFLRRATLDFTGRIPTREQVQQFLTDPAKDKRTRLIDRLFTDPLWAETMAERFHVMLMERRGKDEHWNTWLQTAFQKNKPWDAMVREMIAPDFKDEAKRGAGYFLTKRLEKYGQNPTDHPGLTRDVGRMFMGVDLQCAQCHRHLSVKSYKQVDFQGLFAAYQNLKLQRANESIKVAWVSEGLMKNGLEFSSVFSETQKSTAPRVPFGEEVSIPKFPKGEEWLEAPDRAKRILGTPKFSPLQEIATRMATKDNAYFRRNIANRAWFLMMGRGLVEPLDLAHAKNPPSHPELLDLLANELAAHQFDLKWLLRELALTQTYQRSSVLPTGQPDESLFAAAKERPIAAEVLLRNVLLAVGETERVSLLPDEDNHTRAKYEALFQSTFANAPRDPELAVNATLKAALFLRNNESLLWLLQRRQGNLVDRLATLKTAAAIAEVAFLQILSRPATPDEKAMVKSFLENQVDRDQALGDLAWALMTSAEFFVNH